MEPSAHQRVLFVDDDPSIREIFERTVSRAGYIVDLAGTAAEALELGGSRSYGLLVVDLALDTWNGLDILTRLAPAQPSAALVMVSAHFPPDQQAGDRHTTVDGRPVLMVAKPWRVESLLSTLERALQQTEARVYAQVGVRKP